MRIVWKRPIAILLINCAAVLLTAAAILLAFTTYNRVADILLMASGLLLIVHSLYRMKLDPAYRSKNPSAGSNFHRS